MKFPTNVLFYKKDIIYPDTNCAYKVINNNIYFVDLSAAVCGVDNDETYILGHDWWNDRSHLFDWQLLDNWDKHKKRTWADKFLIIELLKKIYSSFKFNNE
jgi:hypothetical protein